MDQTDPIQPENIQPAKRLKFLLGSIFVLAILGSTLYFSFNDREDAPPSLTPEKSTLQGFIQNNSDNLGFIKVESKDLKTPLNNADQLNLSFDKNKNLGLYLLYTDSASANYETVLQNLSKEALIFMASYDPATEKWITTPHTYFNKDGTTEIEAENFKTKPIKPGQGFVFMTASDLTMYDMEDGSQLAKNDYKICENGAKGWNLFAAHTNDLNSIFQSCSKDIESIYIQKTTDTIDPAKTFNKINLSEIKDIRLSHALVWVKFTAKPVSTTVVQPAAETITVMATSGNKSVALTFTPKVVDSKIKEYKIEYKKKPDSAYSPATGSVSSDNLTFTVTGLEDNTDYDFKITGLDVEKKEVASTTVQGTTLEAVVVGAEPFTIKLLTEFEYSADGETKKVPIPYDNAIIGSKQKLYAFFEMNTKEKITLESITIERQGNKGAIGSFDKINFKILFDGKDYLKSEIDNPSNNSHEISGENLEIDKDQKRYFGIAVDVSADATPGSQDQFAITKLKYKINGESKEETYTDLSGPSIKIVKDNIVANIAVSTPIPTKQLTYEPGDSNLDLGQFLFTSINKDLKIKSIIFEDSLTTDVQNPSTLQDFTKLSLNAVDVEILDSGKTIQFDFNNGIELKKSVQTTISPTGDLKLDAKVGTHNFVLKSVIYLDETEVITKNYDNLFGNLITVSAPAKADLILEEISGIEVEEKFDKLTGQDGLEITWDKISATFLNSDLIENISANADLYLNNDPSKKTSMLDIPVSLLPKFWIGDPVLKSNLNINSKTVAIDNPLIVDMWYEYEINGIKTESKHTIKKFSSN